MLQGRAGQMILTLLLVRTREGWLLAWVTQQIRGVWDSLGPQAA